MADAAWLLDVHARTHRGVARLIDHCRGLRAEDLDREHAGFGYPTVRRQLGHALGAEAYWLGVLEGRLDADDDDERLPDLDAFEARRAEVAQATRAWLAAATPEALATPRPMTTWGGRTRVLVPARVVLRPLMHYFHHQGQVVAMCRLLGRPAEGLDFPLD